MKSSRINLVMTVIGFGLSIMFIVFVCTRLICARILLIASRRSTRASRSDLTNLERGCHGHKPLTPANFSTTKYGELCTSTNESARCIVCLVDYHNEDTLCILPICGHFFHTTCIGIWMQQRSTCPVCRISFGEFPKRKWFMQPMFSSALRSQQSMQSVNANYCNCIGNGNRHMLRSQENEVMDPAQVDQSDESNVGDDNSIPINHEQSMKNPATTKVESPLNK